MFLGLLGEVAESHNTNHPEQPRFEIWTDEELVAGDHWSQKIDEAIDQSFALVIAVTPEAMESHYVTYEWAYALGHKCYVVPVMLKEVPPPILHKKIQDIQWNSFYSAKRTRDEARSLFNILKKKYFELRGQDRVDTGREVAQRILNYLNLGRRQRTSGDYNNALASLRNAEENVDAFNTDFPALSAVAAEAAEESEVDKLVDDLYYEIGLIYYLQHNFDDARKYFDMALEKNPRHVHSLVGLGVLHRVEGDRADRAGNSQAKQEHLDEAHNYFEQALDLQPDIKDQNDESVWASLGGICKRMGHRDSAISYYLMATRFKKSAYPYGNLGLLYMEDPNTREQMIANYRVAMYFARAKLRLHPEDHWAHNDELIAQLVLNTCSGNKSDKMHGDDLQQLIDRVLIVVDGEPLRRLYSVLKNDLLPHDPPVVDKPLVEEILKLIEPNLGLDL